MKPLTLAPSFDVPSTLLGVDVGCSYLDARDIAGCEPIPCIEVFDLSNFAQTTIDAFKAFA